ncbi:MAG: stage II sporulation protein M [Fimbriimonadia bacterium]|jgi:uncharacterized membrane protein SpoIIM required for sporulation
MTHDDLSELQTLYRRVGGDLAYAQSNFSDERVLDYLNDLVARGHALIYAPERKSPASVLRELAHAAPFAIRRRMSYVGVAALITALGAVVGALAQSTDSSWMDVMVPGALRESIEIWQTGEFPEATGSQQFGFMAALNLNNSWVAILMLASGLTFGLLTTYLLAINGMVLGVVIVEVGRAGHLGHLLAGIAAHGVPEFGAILIAGGGGLVLADALLRPGERSRPDALREAGPDCFWMIAFALLLLVIAAILEAYVSHSGLPRGVKLGFAALLLVLLAGFVYGVRR